MDPVDAAAALVEQRFPECLAAFLAGSVVRGEGTLTSDLDIVIITTREEAPFRESLVASGWPVELFVHNQESYRHYFASDARRRMPSLPAMCLEAIVLKDTGGLAQRIKDEARELIERGPEPLTAEEIANARYMVTDVLDDLLGSESPEDYLFVAPELAAAAANLILAYNRQWTGKGKWLRRALNRHDPELARQLTAALQALYQTGHKEPLVRFADYALDLVGGRLFDGYYSSGKRSSSEAGSDQ